MASPVSTIVLNDDGTLVTTTDLVKAAPLLQDISAKAKVGFSLPALLKLVQDLATYVPVIIADVEATIASTPVAEEKA